MLIPEIDSLLEADTKNIPEARRLFFNFHSLLPDTLNTGAVLHDTCARAFSQGVKNPSLPLELAMQMVDVNTLDECLSRLEAPIPSGHEEQFKKARTELNKFYSLQNRAAIFSRVCVLYGFIVADFLRFRVTIPLGCLRLQCESVALMKLMQDDSAVARQWREIKTEKEGKIFYRVYQPKIKEILRSYDLSEAYDTFSRVAMHGSFTGLGYGLRLNTQREDNKVIATIGSTAQEFDPENPAPFLLMVLYALRVQERIFSNLQKAMPEIQDPLLLETRIPQFRSSVDQLFAHFKKQYPEVGERQHRTDTTTDI